jgi:serine/threonine-protein kinase
VSLEDQHPDENTLVEYVRGALSYHGRQAVNVHVDACGDCRRTLAALARHVSIRTAEHSLEVIDTQPNALEVLAGTTLDGRFRLESLLGGGAMGIVFEAEDLQLKERVAVKVLAPTVVQRGDGLEMLRREILLARRVSHPNVCPVYDLGIAGQQHYITMKLVEGRTLDQLLDDGPVTPERAAAILDQLASALATAHEKGVVHRDLKAANVMVSKNGHVWVMDFGLARDLERDPSFSGPVGTPAYWAPEQALGEPATPEADIYSFGVVAYRLFTGKLPRRFTQKTNFDIVPMKWRRLVARCMSERTALRPQNGAELLKEWRAVGSWRARVPLQLAVLVAGLAIAGVVGLLWRGPSSAPEPVRPAVTQPAVTASIAPPEPTQTPEPVAPVQPVNIDAGVPDAAVPPPPQELHDQPTPTVKPKKKPKPADDIPLFE